MSDEPLELNLSVNVRNDMAVQLEHTHVDGARPAMSEIFVDQSEPEGATEVKWTRSIYECTDCGDQVIVRIWLHSQTEVS